jgi:hypothetical protein
LNLPKLTRTCPKTPPITGRVRATSSPRYPLALSYTAGAVRQPWDAPPWAIPRVTPTASRASRRSLPMPKKKDTREPSIPVARLAAITYIHQPSTWYPQDAFPLEDTRQAGWVRPAKTPDGHPAAATRTAPRTQAPHGRLGTAGAPRTHMVVGSLNLSLRVSLPLVESQAPGGLRQ